MKTYHSAKQIVLRLNGAVSVKLIYKLSAQGKLRANRATLLQSYVGQFLQETDTSLGPEDEGAFEMRLLHFRRTFVEKMFAIHAKVVAFKREGQEIGGYARHYYEIRNLLESCHRGK